ncbi:MAG: aldehyde dehydrogenase family protein [Bacteroidia bacterium]|nr:aldehyde dehydrogenase family protein [Bacteroidia bacterium]
MNTLPAASPTSVQVLVNRQRNFYRTGATRPVEARQEQLKTLRQALEAWQDRLLRAVHADFQKPRQEVFLEIGTVLEEIDKAIKLLPTWARTRHISTPIMHKPSSAMQVPEPLGVALVISPWNYPINLALVPVVGAIAAGNTVILKPSELSPVTSQALSEMVAEYFPAEWFTVALGGPEVSQALIVNPVDYVFFTGSPHVGKLIMASAAKNLVPVTLELGGKSPVIIDDKVALDPVARRVLWAKTFNAGQTCLAGDYVLIPHSRKAEFYQKIQEGIGEFFGKNIEESRDFARIISPKNVDRLAAMIVGNVVVGGKVNASARFIEPTVIEVDDPETHPSMQEEIFGPILPVIGYDSIEEALAFVNARPKPLSLYLFSDSSKLQKRVQQETSSGSFVINDLIVQAALSDLPFGGVGNSGMSSYHGEKSFEIFSHFKSIMKRSLLVETPFRFPPYKASLSLMKTIMRWFG